MHQYDLSEKLQILFFILLLLGCGSLFIFGVPLSEPLAPHPSHKEIRATSSTDVSNTYQSSSKGIVIVYGPCKRGEFCLTSKGMALIY